MKAPFKLRSVLLMLIIAGLLGCGGEKLFELKISTKKKQKILTKPIQDEATAATFVKTFTDSLGFYKGKVKWPKDSLGNYVKSWSIDMNFILRITEELQKLDTSIKQKNLRLYPVINDQRAFSIMIVGEYVKDGKIYILRRLVDPKTGDQGPVGTRIAPMYEWLDPCPPLNCPDNDF
ncbi:MAG TPA: hypothetical protein DCM71_21195 [Runella sp.]|nr:hypothetical protein [Runella sp.]